MADMAFRTSFEFPHPNRKLVAHFLKRATTAAERNVWRELLNSSAFHKEKKVPESKLKKLKAEPNSKPKSKK